MNHTFKDEVDANLENYKPKAESLSPQQKALNDLAKQAVDKACQHRALDRQRNFTILIVGFDMNSPAAEQEAIESACNELTGQGTLLAGKSVITESVIYDVGDQF